MHCLLQGHSSFSFFLNLMQMFLWVITEFQNSVLPLEWVGKVRAELWVLGVLKDGDCGWEITLRGADSSTAFLTPTVLLYLGSACLYNRSGLVVFLGDENPGRCSCQSLTKFKHPLQPWDAFCVSGELKVGRGVSTCYFPGHQARDVIFLWEGRQNFDLLFGFILFSSALARILDCPELVQGGRGDNIRISAWKPSLTKLRTLKVFADTT